MLITYARIFGISVATTLFYLFSLVTPVFAETNILHSFTGGVSDGEKPYGSLVRSGDKLYGTTRYGGPNVVSFETCGTIFSINTDGTGYSVIYNFSGGVNNGRNPVSTLHVSGTTLYGMTDKGGANNYGIIFSVQTDGTNFQLLHSFSGGGAKWGYLIQEGEVLYGMASAEGTSYQGAIFSINTNGTNYTLLHDFNGGVNDGHTPYGSLTLSNGVFYGMTVNGGDSNAGVIFSMNQDGSDFRLLHEFADGVNDGAYPYSSLTLSNGVLYGMTFDGGDSGGGVIFSINTDGTGFNLLHEFIYGNTDGNQSENSFYLYGNNLYGITYSGGTFWEGTIFSIETDGSNYTLLHNFDSSSDDGAYPEGSSLILIDNNLYGVTTQGGTSNKGTIFSYSLPTPTPTSTPTPTPSSSSSNSSSSSSSSPPPLPQIPQFSNPTGGGGICNAIVDSNTGTQQVLSIIQAQTFNFDAYLYAQITTPVLANGLLVNPMTGLTPASVLPGNTVVSGDPSKNNGFLGIKTGNGIFWQMGKIMNIWYKAYAPGYLNNNAPKIIPELQTKPSIIILKYQDANLIPPGQPKTKFLEQKLKLAHSLDGKNWKILSNSVVDTVNNSVAVVDRAGGYYMITGRY